MAGYSDVILASAPVAYWRLNETSGAIAADSSGSARDLTLVGVLLNQAGLRFGDSGPCAYFDGSILSYALRNPFTGFPTTNITVSMVVKTLAVPTAATQSMFSYASAAVFNNFLIGNAGRPTLTVHDSGNATSNGAGVNNGQANHLAVTWRSVDGRVQFWLNGTMVYTISGVRTGQSTITSGALVLAQDQDSLGGGFVAADAFQGFLQDVALFGTVLSDADIQRQASLALFGSTANVLRAATLSRDLVRVYFDRPVLGLGAAGNFVFSGGLNASSTTPAADRRSVDVVTTGMVFGTTYTLTVSGVTDDAINPIGVNVVTFLGVIGGSAEESGVVTGQLVQGLVSTLGGAITSGVVTGLRTTTPIVITPTKYTMRAYRALTLGYVFWTVSDFPDLTGAQSGHPPIELSDIVIEQVSCG